MHVLFLCSRVGDDATDYQFKTAKLLDAFRRKLQESFVSVQVEKVRVYRNISSKCDKRDLLNSATMKFLQK